MDKSTSKGFFLKELIKNIAQLSREISTGGLLEPLNDSKWSFELKCVEGLQMWPLVDCFSHNYRIVSNSRGNTYLCVCVVCV